MKKSEGKELVAKGAEKLKSVAEFLGEVVEGFEGGDLLKAAEAATPWLEAGVEAAKETIPFVKAALTFVKKLTEENDPDKLGHIACTLAYDRSVEQAIAALDLKTAARSPTAAETARALKHGEVSPKVDFKTFRLKDALLHPFIVESDKHLGAFAEAVGVRPIDLVNEVHARFPMNLNLILANGETRAKFAPFTEFIRSGAADSELARQMLLDHAEYQRWLYEERPMLGIESFALSDVYIETDCGVLSWGEISEPGPNGSKKDPFYEGHGGRKSVIDAVLTRIADPKFNDLIVIQGVAGAGKTAFTLRLCSELIKQGLRPIRIRFRDLPDSILELYETLAHALQTGHTDQEYRDAVLGDSDIRPVNPFKNGAIFNERVRFSYTSITSTLSAAVCPYVLVLDGWDEVSTAAAGFQEHIKSVLFDIQTYFIKSNMLVAPVRVVITGRPSDLVYKIEFLNETTPIFTIRQFTPKQLEAYADQVRNALCSQRIVVVSSRWQMPSRKDLGNIFKRYSNNFRRVTQYQKKDHRHDLDVLGHPLLAFLVFRTMSIQGKTPDDIFSNQTSVMRELLDAVCTHGGNLKENSPTAHGRLKVTGTELRRLLEDTAAAMSICGQENISRNALVERLERFNPGFAKQLELKASNSEQVHPLSRLVIAFFFKTGREDYGCEFLHKSFREYLFAEKIVAVLKELGLQLHGRIAEPHEPGSRTDFPQGTSLWLLSRNLSELLAPQWVTSEIFAHLYVLLQWEIFLASQEQDVSLWTTIRDNLATLWEWWVNGAHLTPQQDNMEPYAIALSYWCHPQLDRAFHSASSRPPSIIAVDARLGEGLFQLCASTHELLVRVDESRHDTAGHVSIDIALATGSSRRFQRPIGRSMRFSPGGPNKDGFLSSIRRIASASARPEGLFPARAFLSRADLSQYILRQTDFTRTNLSQVNLTGADLTRANLTGANLIKANLTKANLTGANLTRANLTGANLTEVNLSGADLTNADLVEANLAHANLVGADLTEASLCGANLTGANLSRATPTRANLTRVDLTGAYLVGAYLAGADLTEADLTRAYLKAANLKEANLTGANLTMADLRGADRTNCILERTIVDGAIGLTTTASSQS